MPVLGLSSVPGHSRRSDRSPVTSGLPQLAGIRWVHQHLALFISTSRSTKRRFALLGTPGGKMAASVVADESRMTLSGGN
jgi:hypothetical protein